MTKREMLSHLDMTEPQLAKKLDITSSAVYQWPDDESLPLARELQIRHVLFPEKFEHAKPEEPAEA